MQLVALTGNIASGKSTVARRLADRGAAVVDADDLARRAVEPGSAALGAIAARWGAGVLQADGALDRAALRHIVFGDASELAALNAIVHPEVERLRTEAFDEARRRGARVVVYDVPLLFERGLDARFEHIILVDAPAALRLERLVQERGLARDEAARMIASQLPSETKRARSTYVIDNAGTLDELRRKADDVWRELEGNAERERARDASVP
jgi:dephospho-CoA kinase